MIPISFEAIVFFLASRLWDSTTKRVQFGEMSRYSATYYFPLLIVSSLKCMLWQHT